MRPDRLSICHPLLARARYGALRGTARAYQRSATRLMNGPYKYSAARLRALGTAGPTRRTVRRRTRGSRWFDLARRMAHSLGLLPINPRRGYSLGSRRALYAHRRLAPSCCLHPLTAHGAAALRGTLPALLGLDGLHVLCPQPPLDLYTWEGWRVAGPRAGVSPRRPRRQGRRRPGWSPTGRYA